MLHDRTVRFGMIGVVIAALCCFTPILAMLLAAVSIGWAIAYLDYALLPALFFFTGLTVYALWKRSHVPVPIDSKPNCACPPSPPFSDHQARQ